MPGSSPEEQASRLEQEQVRLRQRIAELAATVATTEEAVAGTLEQTAEHRSPPDAARLRREAEEAKEYAAKERERSGTHGKRADSA